MRFTTKRLLGLLAAMTLTALGAPVRVLEKLHDGERPLLVLLKADEHDHVQGRRVVPHFAAGANETGVRVCSGLDQEHDVGQTGARLVAGPEHSRMQRRAEHAHAIDVGHRAFVLQVHTGLSQQQVEHLHPMAGCNNASIPPGIYNA